MSAIQGKNLEQALAHHTRHVKRDAWAVLSGTSTTVFTVQRATDPGTVPDLDTGAQNDLTGEIVVFHSGANAGVERAITSAVYASGTLTITLAAALPNTPSADDRFTIYSAKVATTTTGKLSLSTPVVQIANVAEAAATAFGGFTAPHTGTARILAGASAAATLSLTGAGQTNALGSLSAATWATYNVPVVSGATYSFQVSAAVTVSLIVNIATD